MSTGSSYAPAPPYASDYRPPSRWIEGVIAALAFLIVASLVLTVLVGVSRGDWGMGMWWGPNTTPWNWVGGLIGLLIAVVIILAIVRAVYWAAASPWDRHYYRHYYRHHPEFWGAWGRDPSVELARQRYARGEITRDQYNEIVRDLGYPNPPVPPP